MKTNLREQLNRVKQMMKNIQEQDFETFNEPEIEQIDYTTFKVNYNGEEYAAKIKVEQETSTFDEGEPYSWEFEDVQQIQPEQRKIPIHMVGKLDPVIEKALIKTAEDLAATEYERMRNPDTDEFYHEDREDFQ